MPAKPQRQIPLDIASSAQQPDLPLPANKSRAAKEALGNMELYTNNVINSMPAGLISLDPEQRIVTANSAALTIFGSSEATSEARA